MSKKACGMIAVVGVLLCLGASWIETQLVSITGISRGFFFPAVYLLGIVYLHDGSRGYFDPDFRGNVWQLVSNFASLLVMVTLVHLAVRVIKDPALTFGKGLVELLVAGIHLLVMIVVQDIGGHEPVEVSPISPLAARGRTVSITLGVFLLTYTLQVWDMLMWTRIFLLGLGLLFLALSLVPGFLAS